MGNYQSELKRANRHKILAVLKDGKKHQYSEVLNSTKLSRPILAKHFRDLQNKHLIEKEESKEDFRVVFYKATPILNSLFFQEDYIKAGWDDTKNRFLETKDLSSAIKDINLLTNSSLVIAFTDIQQKKFDISKSEDVETFLELFAWSTYENLTLNLVNLCVTNNLVESINLGEVAKKLAEN